MKTWILLGAFVALGAVILSSQQQHETAAEEEKMLVHAVYFTLNDNSQQAQSEFVQLCQEYLAGHEGTTHFGVGTRAKEFDREVNDQEYDIALYIAFESKAAHDKYQDHPRHLEFIAKGRDKWKKVRVCDSYMAQLRQ